MGPVIFDGPKATTTKECYLRGRVHRYVKTGELRLADEKRDIVECLS